MAIYKFRALWEEKEEVECTVLIRSNQTFADFFYVLADAFELINKDVSASFFTSDDYWDKHTEITLKEEDIQDNEKLMHKTKIASLIEHSRQRFVLVYDAQLQLTFHIELIKIEPDGYANANANVTFPKILSKQGKIPKRRKTIQPSKKTTSATDTNSINPMSDDDIDQMIYNTLMTKNISEEDLLSDDKLAELFDDLKKNAPSDNTDDETDEDEASEEYFDTENNAFDEDDFKDNGYLDTNDEFEN